MFSNYIFLRIPSDASLAPLKRLCQGPLSDPSAIQKCMAAYRLPALKKHRCLMDSHTFSSFAQSPSQNRPCRPARPAHPQFPRVTFSQSGFFPQDRRGTRLYQIARQCVNYGQRVQASMSECLVDAAQCRSLRVKLCAVMVPGRDSLRFYDLAL